MSTVQFRPTFYLKTQLGEEELKNCIIKAFTTGEDGSREETWHGQFTSHHAMISIDESKRHFWSPWMHLEFRKVDDGQQIHGRFSPHPSIWTGIMFSYLGLGVLIFFALMLGLSQQLSAQTPWGYYAIPVGLVAGCLIWIAARVGQNLARDEMRQMKARLEQCVDCKDSHE